VTELSQVGDDADDADVSSNLAQAAEADAAEASSNIHDANACLLMLTVTLTALVLAAGCAGRCTIPSRAFLRFDRSVPFPKLRSSRTSVAVATITVMIAVRHHKNNANNGAPVRTVRVMVGSVLVQVQQQQHHRRHHHHRQVAMIAACDGRGGRPDRR
jgi:hypothetical protein